MEEIIGFTLVGLLVLTLGLGIKKLFTKKKDAFQYEDETARSRSKFLFAFIRHPEKGP